MQSEIKKQAIIIDLDKTLALIGERNPYDASDCGYDKLDHTVYRMIMKYHKDDYAVLILTGRKITFAHETMEWLDKHNVPFDMVIMRDKKETSPSPFFKMGAFTRNIKGKYDVELAIDDDERVCKMWHSLGIPTFQVMRSW